MANNKSNSKGSIVSSEAFPGMLLLGATILALILANTELEKFYNYILFELKIGEEFNLHLFVNDFLMAIFFLFVGCEIKRELVYGKLSSIKQASFPVLAAIGGMVAPALIFTLFNYNSGFEIGAGVPLSTDIAFAIGIFSILESRMNSSLKLFLLTLAVVDDLLSIIIIGVFYSSNIRITGIIISIVLTIILFSIKFFNKKNKLYPYIENAPLTTSGHLIVVCGFSNKNGEQYVVVNDPAAEDDESVRVEYRLEQFMEAWSNSDYIMYIVH